MKERIIISKSNTMGVGNFSINKIEWSGKEEVLFYIDHKPILIKRCDLLFSFEDGRDNRIIVSNNSSHALRELCANVTDDVSIYVDNIIVSKAENDCYLLYQFVFSIEK